jgi:hypothetical protein
MAGLSGGALGGGVPVEATQDALFGGSVVLFQPPRGAGYRTNVDALLLAGFATGAHAAPVAFDLGSGVGAVGLALLRLGAARRVVLVEVDEQPAAMARRNLDANGWTERGEVVRADVRDVARCRDARSVRRARHLRQGGAPGSRSTRARLLRLPGAGARGPADDAGHRRVARKAPALRSCHAGVRGPGGARRGGGGAIGRPRGPAAPRRTWAPRVHLRNGSPAGARIVESPTHLGFHRAPSKRSRATAHAARTLR